MFGKVQGLLYGNNCKNAIGFLFIYNWIKPFASDLGIRDILSTEIEVDGEGCLTGFFSNKNCYGQEKFVRLLEQIPDLENNYLIVYGDSKGDSQLLKYANESHYRAL